MSKESEEKIKQYFAAHPEEKEKHKEWVRKWQKELEDIKKIEVETGDVSGDLEKKKEIAEEIAKNGIQNLNLDTFYKITSYPFGIGFLEEMIKIEIEAELEKTSRLRKEYKENTGFFSDGHIFNQGCVLYPSQIAFSTDILFSNSCKNPGASFYKAMDEVYENVKQAEEEMIELIEMILGETEVKEKILYPVGGLCCRISDNALELKYILTVYEIVGLVARTKDK